MTAAAADSQKQRGQTAYRVLKKVKSAAGGPDSASASRNETWEVVATVKAANREAAVKAHADKHTSTDANGTYIAVSDRAFQPVEVTVETQRVVKVK